MSPTVAWLVTVVSLLNIAAMVALLWWTRRTRGEASSTTETTGHVWDDDLREYNNPLPRWWLWLFLLTVVFALAYLFLYPGLGSYAGSKGWSQERQYQEQTERAEALLARTFAPFEQQTVTALVGDDDALRIGRNLFMNNCATCHGSDARGAPGFPNLTDKDWLWGGSPEAVVESISNGRTGVMAPWAATLGGSGVEDVLAYVLSLSGRQVPAGSVDNGRRRYGEICVACHGPEGRGNPLLGAPDLTDQTWLHGGGVATVRATIADGRQGVMPAHLERFGETRVKLLAAYVLSLGDSDASRSATAASTATASTGPASAH